jgi:hypothetical protein
MRDNSNKGSVDLYLRAVSGEIRGYLVSKQITDIAYVLRKYVDKSRIRSFVLFLCRSFIILPFAWGDIEQSTTIEGKDFEDDILIHMAQVNGMDCIVTNNLRNFITDRIRVFSPDGLVNII